MKLIINNLKFNISNEKAKILAESYKKGDSIFQINGNVFFRGAITNSIIITEEKFQESEMKKLEYKLKDELKEYKNATADVKKNIRQRNQQLDKYLSFTKSLAKT